MALSDYDKQVREAGYNYIPRTEFLLSPFKIPEIKPIVDTGTGGIPTLIPRDSGGSGALQAGDINYGDFSKAGFDAYANRQPTPLVDNLYQSKLDKTFMGFPSYKEQELTGPDMGEYIASGTDIPLELTRAGKIQESLGGIKEGIGGFVDKMGGFGPVSAVLSRMDKFDTLPELDQQFIKQSMGYRGPTVFGENTGGGYVDPFGVNVRSAFGNYAEKVRDDFSSLEDSLTGRLTDKYGAQFNPATGLFESDDEEAAALANKNTKMMRKKYAFRKKQLEQQAFDEEIAAKKAAEEAEKARLEKERTAVIQGLLDEGGYDSTSSKSDRDRSTVTESSAAATKGVGGGGYTASDSVRESQRGNYGSSSGGVRDSGGSTGGYSYGGGGRQGFGYGLADGGRVYYMDGGLADLVDIYD